MEKSSDFFRKQEYLNLVSQMIYLKNKINKIQKTALNVEHSHFRKLPKDISLKTM